MPPLVYWLQKTYKQCQAWAATMASLVVSVAALVDQAAQLLAQNITIISLLGELQMALATVAQDVARLQASFAALKTVDDAAVTLLGQLAASIRQNVADPVALTALADQIDAEMAKMKTAEATVADVVPKP